MWWFRESLKTLRRNRVRVGGAEFENAGFRRFFWTGAWEPSIVALEKIENASYFIANPPQN